MLSQPKHLTLLQEMFSTVKKGKSAEFTNDDIRDLTCSSKPSELIRKLRLLGVNIVTHRNGSRVSHQLVLTPKE